MKLKKVAGRVMVMRDLVFVRVWMHQCTCMMKVGGLALGRVEEVGDGLAFKCAAYGFQGP